MENGEKNKTETIEANGQQEGRDTRPISHENAPARAKANGEAKAQAKRKTGAPFGNSNAMTHGMSRIDLDYQQRRPVDKRTRSGKIEAQVLQALIAAYGGPEKMGPRKMIQIQITAYDASRYDEHKRARSGVIRRNPKIRKNPKALQVLDGYMQPCVNSLRQNLAELGPEPQGPKETLYDLIERITEKNAEEEADGATGKPQPGNGEAGAL
jgi:hypothetical protein